MPGSEDKELIKNVRASRDDKGRILVSSVCQRLKEQGFNVAGTIVSYYSPIEEMYIFVGKDPISLEKDGVSVDNLTKNRLHLKFRPGQDSSPKAGGHGGMESSMPISQSHGKTLPLNYHLEPNSLSFGGGGMNASLGGNTSAFNSNLQSNAAPPPVPNPNANTNSAIPLGGGMNDDSNDKESNTDQNTLEIWSSAKANRRTKERKISFVIEKVSMWRKLYNGIQDNQGKIVRYR